MLPKIEYPLYEIYLHSQGRKLKFRPFLVKEEKILLMAKEAKDAESAKLAVCQIIQNCAAEPLEVEKLPLFDIEMLFVKLRAKSVGESVRLVFNCKNEIPGEDGLIASVCNTDTDYTLDLEKVKYEIPEGHDPKIMITDKIGVRLRYLTMASDININEDGEAYDQMLALLLSSIDYIFDEDSVTKREDCTDAQLIEFIESVTPEFFEKVKAFFSTAPRVVLEDKVKCKRCGFEHTLHTENLLDFFI
jgi:hypothetical protein